MKRFVKITALCLCIVALTALFAGCDRLDELKSKHALLSEDKTTITFCGETYKALPQDLCYYFSDGYSYEMEDVVYVTDSDVPVLLSASYCYNSYYNEISDVFRVFKDELTFDFEFTLSEVTYFYESYAEGDATYYCNEKDYDKYAGVDANTPMEHIGFEYEVSKDDIRYYYVLEVASQKLSDEIFAHIKNPAKMTNALFEEINSDPGIEILQSYLYKCDSTGVLAEQLDNYDVYKDIDGKAYLVNYIASTAVELSSSAAEELKYQYFYGDYPDSIDKWQNTADIMGGADSDVNIIV